MVESITHMVFDYYFILCIAVYSSSAEYGNPAWRVTLLLMAINLNLNVIFTLRKMHLKKLGNFYDSLWVSNEFLEDKGLFIRLESGQIELRQNDLSKFVGFKDKNGYVFSIPFFDWFVEVNSDTIPFRLKPQLFRKRAKRGNEIKPRQIFKILTINQKKKILYPVLLELSLLVVYHILYIIFQDKLVIFDSLMGKILTLMIYIGILFYSKYLFKELTNNEISFLPGIGLPKVDGEVYVYHTEGMIVRLSSEHVNITYDEKLGILFTDIGSFRYARKVHKFAYKDFQKLIQKND